MHAHHPTLCSKLLLTFQVVVACAASVIDAQDWPQFRGPNGNGHAEAMSVPTKWSEDENVTWKTPLPGRGWSSPVVSGDFIWMTAAIESKEGPVDLIALCVEKESGKLRSRVQLFHVDEPGGIHALNSYASPTPVISGESVFCHFGNFGTACLDQKSGRIKWKTDRFEYETQNGPGASPVVWKNLLLFNCDGMDVQFAVALDQATGETVWKVDRSGKLPEKEDFKKSYCTPAIVVTKNGPQLISPASDWVYAYDPASGKELWKVNYGQLGFSTVPKPIFKNGTAFVLTSFMKSRLLAIDCEISAMESDSRVKWTNDTNMPQKPSLLQVEKHLYAIGDRGILTCLNTETGEQVFKDRIGGNFAASPLFAGGNVYLFDQKGKTTVFKHGDKLNIIAKNQLDGKFMASPAVSGNSLFLRTDKAIYRID